MQVKVTAYICIDYIVGASKKTTWWSFGEIAERKHTARSISDARDPVTVFCGPAGPAFFFGWSQDSPAMSIPRPSTLGLVPRRSLKILYLKKLHLTPGLERFWSICFGSLIPLPRQQNQTPGFSLWRLAPPFSTHPGAFVAFSVSEIKQPKAVTPSQRGAFIVYLVPKTCVGSFAFGLRQHRRRSGGPASTAKHPRRTCYTTVHSPPLY